MNSCSTCEAAKRLRREEEDTTDRLSYLPDFILHHILSFLDTKFVVQTSVLSRVWRCVWKHVPALNLQRPSFDDVWNFVKFGNKVLSLRYHRIEVQKITLFDEVAWLKQRYKAMIRSLMEYAASHGTQHLVIVLMNDCTFSDLFDTVSSSSLRILDLKRITFVSGVQSSGFRMVTALSLINCSLYPNEEGVFEWTSNFPCLVDLVVIENIWGKWCNTNRIKIHGPELVSLKFDRGRDWETEIVAPKLKFFTLKFTVGEPDSPGFSKLSLPSVDHVDILMRGVCPKSIKKKKGLQEHDLDQLLGGFLCAKSLVMRCDDDRVLEHLCKYMKQKQLSFTRLESLVCVSEFYKHRKVVCLKRG